MTSSTGEGIPSGDIQIDQDRRNLKLFIDTALTDLPIPVSSEEAREVIDGLAGAIMDDELVIREADSREMAIEIFKKEYLAWVKESVLRDITRGDWAGSDVSSSEGVSAIAANERYSVEAYIRFLYTLLVIAKVSYTD